MVLRIVSGKQTANKWPCWPQNSGTSAGTTGSPEQFENFLIKYLNLCKTLTRSFKWFGICLISAKKFSSAFREAIRSGIICYLYRQCNFFLWDWALRRNYLYKMFVCTSLLLAHLLDNFSILVNNTPHLSISHIWDKWSKVKRYVSMWFVLKKLFNKNY